MVFLGVVTCPAGVGKNNRTTAVPFLIPGRTRALRLLTAGTDLAVEVKPDATVASTFATTNAAGLLLQQNVPLDVSAGDITSNLVVAAFSTAGGAVRVWALLG